MTKARRRKCRLLYNHSRVQSKHKIWIRSRLLEQDLWWKTRTSKELRTKKCTWHRKSTAGWIQRLLPSTTSKELRTVSSVWWIATSADPILRWNQGPGSPVVRAVWGWAWDHKLQVERLLSQRKSSWQPTSSWATVRKWVLKPSSITAKRTTPRTRMSIWNMRWGRGWPRAIWLVNWFLRESPLIKPFLRSIGYRRPYPLAWSTNGVRCHRQKTMSI